MYRSLQENAKGFHLFILAVDDKCYEILLKLSLTNVTVISLTEFEDEQLLEIKKTRTSQEYYWTCTPSIIFYCINKYNLKICTYIDADLLFYSDPKILIEELGDASVLITEHRYTAEYDQTSASGKYCVQFVAFKNDINGMNVLNWWKQACLDWCYARFEDGKFGDQKYLDNWATRFKGVHELQHLGGGVAPWNVQQYKIVKKDKLLYCIDRRSKLSSELIFYHFHGVKFFKNKIVSFHQYALKSGEKKLLYKNYIQRLELAKKDILNIDSTIDPHGASSVWEGRIYTLKDFLVFYFKDIIIGSREVLKHALTLSYIRNLIKTHNYYELGKF
jgi:hypothetical protein